MRGTGLQRRHQACDVSMEKIRKRSLPTPKRPARVRGPFGFRGAVPGSHGLVGVDFLLGLGQFRIGDKAIGFQRAARAGDVIGDEERDELLQAALLHDDTGQAERAALCREKKRNQMNGERASALDTRTGRAEPINDCSD